MRRSSSVCARPAPSSSARPTCTSSRSARPARNRRSGRSAIRSTSRDRPADRAADRRRRWPPAWRSARSAPTPAARFASRPRRAAPSASSRPPGEISADGVVPLGRTLDHVGPMARTVADAGCSIRCSTGIADGGAGPAAAGPVSALTFGVPRPYFCDLLDDGSGERARARPRRRSVRAGHDGPVDVEIQHAAWTPHVYLHIVLAEAAWYHAPLLDAARVELFARRAAAAGDGPVRAG